MASEIKYPVSTVAIQNRMQECFKAMSVDEKRLLILASPLARNLDATEQTSILISAQDFATECQIKTNSAYKQIEIASRKLIERSFSYTNEKGKKVHSNWIIDATYEEAGITIRFTSVVLLMLKVLDKHNPYTKYKKTTVLKLKKDYAIDFYHLAKKHEKLGGFYLSLDQLFAEFGLPESYRDLSNLKRRVLKTPLDEINTHTEITMSYTPIKKGRSVVGYEFSVKPKILVKEDSQKTKPSKPLKLTEAQINAFAPKLAEDATFGSKFAQDGEEMSSFIYRLRQELSQEKFLKKYLPYLKDVGFSC